MYTLLTITPSSNQPLNFSCRFCGRSYTIYPPDSSFKKAFLFPCKEKSNSSNHNFKQTVECENCHKVNELYWCEGHHFVVSASPNRNIGRSDFGLRDRYDRF